MGLPDVDYRNSAALVTGASSGIGRAIAFELVKRGIGKLAIHGRNQEKLDSAVAEIKQLDPDVDVRTITADLADRDGVDTVAKELDSFGWQVDIVVNNAGLARKYIFASDAKVDVALPSVDVMVRAPVDFMLRYLPGMVERRRGGFLNVGSTAGHQPVPWTAAYAAAKAFVHSFSQAVRQENLSGDTGVRVACIVPGITNTNLAGEGQGGEKRGLLDNVGVHEPEDVAKAAVDAFEKNAPAQIVGFNNTVLATAIGAVPQSVAAKFVAVARGQGDFRN